MAATDCSSTHDSNGQPQYRRSFGRLLGYDGLLPLDLVERVWQNPRQLLADGTILQRKFRCIVVQIDHAAGPFVWKHHTWRILPNFRRTLMWSLFRSPAQKAWLDGHLLHDQGVPTPRPRAYVEQRIGPYTTSSFVLTDYIAGTSLYRLMRFGRPTKEFARRIAQQVAQIWQRLDDLRVCHHDFKPENLLVDPQGKVWLIDLDRLRRYRRLDEVRRGQARDAADLLHVRNWRADPEMADLCRQEILQTRAAAEALANHRGSAHPLTRPAPRTNSPAQLVTVLIPCCNSAATIRACLDSVRDMADEILVADAGSTDDTLRLAHEFGGCRIIRQTFADEVAFADWAHEHASHPWILRIEPDEQLTAELGRQVQDLLAAEPAEDSFRIARATYSPGGRRKSGGFEPDGSIRLYRKKAGRYEVRNGRIVVTVPSQNIGRVASRLIYDVRPSVSQPDSDAIHRRAG